MGGSMVITSIDSESDIGKLVDDGVVISFADNGYLPGDALVRIKATDTVNSVLNGKKAHVYLYNEDEDNFYEVATNVKKTKDEKRSKSD